MATGCKSSSSGSSQPASLPPSDQSLQTAWLSEAETLRRKLSFVFRSAVQDAAHNISSPWVHKSQELRRCAYSVLDGSLLLGLAGLRAAFWTAERGTKFRFVGANRPLRLLTTSINCVQIAVDVADYCQVVCEYRQKTVSSDVPKAHVRRPLGSGALDFQGGGAHERTRTSTMLLTRF